MLIEDNIKYLEIYNQDLPKNASDVILKCDIGKYHNLMTGKCGQNIYDVIRYGYEYIVINKTAYEYTYGFFSTYNDELDIFILTPVFINTLVDPVAGEKRYWEKIKYDGAYDYEYVSPLIFTKDINIYCLEYSDVYKKCLKRGIDVYTNQSVNKDCDNIGLTYHVKSISAASKFFGYIFTIPGKAAQYKLMDTKHYYELAMAYGNYKSQEYSQLENVINISVDSLSSLDKNKIFKIIKYGEDNEYFRYFVDETFRYNYAKISRVDEEIACISIYGAAVDYNKIDVYYHCNIDTVKQLSFCEYIRVYVLSDGIYTYIKEGDKWCEYKGDRYLQYFRFILLDIDYEIFNDTKFKYVRDFVLDCFDDDVAKCLNKSMVLYSVLSLPLIESLLKSKYDCFRDIFNLSFYELGFDYNISLDSFIEHFFGDVVFNENSFIKAIGVSSCFFDEINNIYKDNKLKIYKSDILSIIKSFKYIFENNVDYFLGMNNKQIKEIVSLYVKSIYLCYSSNDINTTLKKMISISGVRNIMAYLKQIVYIGEYLDGNRHDMHGSNKSLITYIDYVKMFYELRNILVDFKFNIKTFDDLIKEHDNALYIYNMVDNKERELIYKEEFDKNKKIWDKLEYCNDRFKIIAPSSIAEIAYEGDVLKHCVKSYIDDILSGKTIIMFIRMNYCPEKPFYTLEIRNNQLRQCHGALNRNINKVRELEEFLKDFCEAKNIVYQNCDDVLIVD